MKYKHFIFMLMIHMSSLALACGFKDNCSEALDFNVAMSSDSLLAGQPQKAYLNIDIIGHPHTIKRKRPQANIAFVLDKSGSMSGHKMNQAKQALEMAVSRLNASDIVSLIVYDGGAQVMWPAAVLQSPRAFLKTVASIGTGGSTALFAGVTQGGYEVRKFLADNKVNRIVLLSDGIANVGPSEPHELAELGRAFSKQRISVSTIGLGLGYNEDLMTQLAGNSDGNHYFVEDADKLAQVFDAELGDVFSVVAQDVVIDIDFKNGVKPVRVLGREDSILGQKVSSRFNQIYGDQKRHLTLEVMVPAGIDKTTLAVADLSIKYQDAMSGGQSAHQDSVAINFTNQAEEVDKDKNMDVMANVVSLKANEMSKKVVELRDSGDLDGAAQLQQLNVERLEEEAENIPSPKLKAQISQEKYLLDNIKRDDWGKARKQVRKNQYAIDNQQKDEQGDN